MLYSFGLAQARLYSFELVPSIRLPGPIWQTLDFRQCICREFIFELVI